MFNFESLNTATKYDYVFPENTEYFKLKDLDKDSVYIIRNIFFNTKSKFGEQALVGITDKDEKHCYYITMPNYSVQMMKEINENSDAIDAINEGHCGIKLRPYKSKKFGEQMGFVFVNL